VPIKWEAGSAPLPGWMFQSREKSLVCDTSIVQPIAKLLYQLRYPGFH